MTVSTTSISKSTSGNGSATSFPYDYKILEASDLQVIIRSATGAETIKATSTYTVTGVGADSGTIVFNSSNVPASGETVVVTRNVLQTQAIDYIANDPFPAETHEEGLDRATMVIQQVSGDADRSIKISKTNTMTSTEFTVGPADRANKVLSFDSNGELSVAQELGTFKGNSATTTTAAYVVRDIVKSTTTAQLNNIYICIQASPIGTALTNTSYWTLIVDAVSAASSATAAAASATTAGNCATASASSATTSGNCATLSGNCATASANSATASANSATASASSATDAAASFDSFDDRYLGAKSSAPTTDNDGNALLTGALYFNSSSNQIFSWTGSAWTAIKPTSAEQAQINLLGVSAVISDMAILGTTDVVADMAILATTDVVADMNVLGTADVVTDMNVLGTADVVNDMNVLASSGTVTAMNLLGTSAVVTDMGILGTADVVADMNVLATADVVADMNTLGTAAIVADMAILGTNDVVADMAILATSDIVTDMNVLGTSANVTAMGLLGTSANVANMASVCANLSGINSFAERYRIVSSNPTSSLDAGDLAFVTNDSNLKFYNGSAWVAISPGIANVVDDSTPQLGGNLDLNSNNITGTGGIPAANLTGTIADARLSSPPIPSKVGGTNFTNSLLVGTSSTGTLNDANSNTGVGIGVFGALTSGDNNVAVGLNALDVNTTGSDNTSAGSLSLNVNTTGSSNTGFGRATLLSNTTASENTAIGGASLLGKYNRYSKHSSRCKFFKM